ncbi:MAG: sulfurtransferase TusA family protein [Advenella sp.]|jgi:tRNA 2-thiouridine synthesizing protein A|nr:sulfurtransferase TusA family protein [Advenella sp.]
MSEKHPYVLEVDTSGLKCPLPILKAKKALATIESGQVLRIITTDKNAIKDFQAFSAQTKNELVAQEILESGAVHYLKRR